MDTNYIFVFKNTNEKRLAKIVWFLFFAVIVCFFLLIIYGTNKSTGWFFFVRLGAIILAPILFSKIKKSNRITLVVGLVFSTILSAFIYYFLGLPFAILLFSFISFLFWLVMQISIATISSFNIVFKTGFSKKVIYWQEINNVVLKDGILTIDFKNDKLIQEEVIDLEKYNVADFNSNMQRHLNQ